MKVVNPGFLTSQEKLMYRSAIMNEVIDSTEEKLEEFFKGNIMHGDALKIDISKRFEVDFK